MHFIDRKIEMYFLKREQEYNRVNQILSTLNKRYLLAFGAISKLFFH